MIVKSDQINTHNENGSFKRDITQAMEGLAWSEPCSE